MHSYALEREIPMITAASSTEHVRFSVSMLTVLRLDEAADGLDALERDGADGDDVAGSRRDDPLRGADGDADMAEVVHWDRAAVEDEVAGADRLGAPVDGDAVVSLRGTVVREIDADLLVGAHSES